MPRKRSHKTGRRAFPGEFAARAVLLRAGVTAAQVRRGRLDGTTFVAITGSAGKSTTTALITAILANEGSVTTTPRNSNRLSIVGRTILRTPRGTDYCVIEAAASQRGSVGATARLLRPNVAVVTRIGLDHFREFRTLDAVAAEKRALVEALEPGGVAVLNADDPFALAMGEGADRVVTFGESDEATVRATDVRSRWPEGLAFTVHADGQTFPVRTRRHGTHAATSVLAALAAAHALGVPLDRAIGVVEPIEPLPGRMSVLRAGGVTFVRDDLKAPGWSLDAPLEFLGEAEADRKVVIMGTISDTPGSSSAVYKRAARRSLEVADHVVFVGPNASAVRRHAERSEGALRWFDTVPEAIAYLDTELRDGDLVLLKGSNRADHLLRIPLARIRTVRCDRGDCRRIRFCDSCRLLATPGRRPRPRATGER